MAEKRRGRCKVCGKWVALRKNGTLYGHGARDRDWCEGAWELPEELSHPPGTTGT